MQLTQISQNYFVAPQILVTDAALLKEHGFTLVICNRPDDEDPGQPSFAEIAAACESVGILCHHIPFAGMPLPIQDIERHCQLVDNNTGKTLGYCRSGQRSEMIYSAGA